MDALAPEPRETWAGTGFTNQRVHALATGTVTDVKDVEIWLEHRFLDNGQP